MARNAGAWREALRRLIVVLAALAAALLVISAVAGAVLLLANALHMPAPHLDAHAPQLPNTSAPDPPTTTGAAPSVDGATPGPVGGAPQPVDPGPHTYYRRVNLHVHEWSLLWVFSVPWWPLALLFLFGCLSRLRRPVARTGRTANTAFGLLLTAAAIAATAIAITVSTPHPGPLRHLPPRTETHQLRNGDTEVVTTYEVRHRHPSIEISVAWVLIGTGAATLGVRRLVAAARRRRPPSRGHRS